MGWILRRGISCCRWAREDCHLVLVLCGLEMLALSHWERRALVQEAMLGCQAWDVMVLLKTLLLVVGSVNDMELVELQPRPRHLLSIMLVKPDGNIAGSDNQPQLFVSSVDCSSTRDLDSTNIYRGTNRLRVPHSRMTIEVFMLTLQCTKVADTTLDRY
jgi:hypothetical protein